MATTPGNNQSQAHMPPEAQHVPVGMARDQFRGMGTTISLLVPADKLQRGTEIVQSLFATWEQALSRFRPDSELSHLNRSAGLPCIVSDLLFKVLFTALAAARATDGLYDPALLTQIVQAGYDRSFDELPATLPATGLSATPGGRWRDIHIDPAVRLVVLPPDIGLDFGGIAKGMAVDAALEDLYQEGIYPALVNAGGDLAVRDLPPVEGQWPIEIQGKTRSWVIPLQRGACATSGVARRHWQQGTQTRHHLLDPRTGQSAQSGLWSVSVVASRCEQAEVAAKVAFLLGSEQGSAFLHRHDLASLLVHEDGSWTTTGSWPLETMRDS